MRSERDHTKVLLIRNRLGMDGFLVLSGDAREPGSSEETMSQDALEEVLELNRPDVIVLDLEIPIRNGVALMRTLEAACPEAEVMTRVDSRSLEPRFFSVRSSAEGLSLEPLEMEDLRELPAEWTQSGKVG